MSTKKYYTVKSGYNSGIYTDWEETRQEVEGFSGNSYKGFSNQKDAIAFLLDSKEKSSGILKKIKFDNFKSFEGESIFYVEDLTTIIGLNASGKSNIIEGLSILSSVSRENSLTSILNNENRLRIPIRGGASGCLRKGRRTFGLGCTIEKENGVNLEYFIKLKVEDDDRVFIDEESLIEVENENKENNSIIFRTIRNNKRIADVSVEYDNKKRGKNPRVVMDRSKSVLSQLDENRILTNSQLSSIANLIEEANKSGDTIDIKEISNLSHSKSTIFEEISLVKNILSSMFMLNINPNKIRDYVRRDSSELTYDAGNLSAVLDSLKGYTRRFEKFEKQMSHVSKRAVEGYVAWKDILDTIDVIPEYKINNIEITVTPPPYRDVIFTCIEQIDGKEIKIPATSLSDGTISVIAITTAVVTYPIGSIIVIDEFDNGIHHSKAIQFWEKIQKIAKERNITLVLTTHNTTLLNALSGNEYSGVNVVYRLPETSNSKITKFVDIPNFEKIIATGGLGKAVAKDGLLSYINSKPVQIELPDWLRGL